MFEIMDNENQEAVIKVIGVGGCGGNAVEHMIAKNVGGVEFICANTDMQALKKAKRRLYCKLVWTSQRVWVQVLNLKSAEKLL